MVEEAAAETGQAAASAARALAVEQIRAAQNFTLAIPAGLAAALLGAGLWAAFTVVTEMQLGLIAIAIGYVVGQAIQRVGKGVDTKFGVLGALCALFGCVLGNCLSALAFVAQAKHISMLGLLSPAIMIRATTSFAQPMDLLFYGIAVYEGYRFSFKYRLK
jgi:hypothetical protein